MAIDYGIKATFGNNTIFDSDKNKLAFSSEFNHPKVYKTGRISGTSQTITHPFGYPPRVIGYLLRDSKYYISYDKDYVFTNYNFEIADGGARSPTGAGEDTSSGTIRWNDFNNIKVSDQTYSVATFSGAANSVFLLASSFNFNIPSGATILGITVSKAGLYTGTLSGTSYARLRLDGANVGDTKSGNFTTSYSYITHGGSSDLWGRSWTRAEVMGQFEVALWTEISSGSGDIKVDHVEVVITYSDSLGHIRTDSSNIYLTSGQSNELIYVNYIDPSIAIPVSRDLTKGNTGLKFSNLGTLTAKDFQQKLTTEYKYLKIIQEGDVTVTADAISGGPTHAQKTNTVDVKNPLGYAAHIIVFDEIGRNSFSYYPKATGLTVSGIAAETEVYITSAIIRFRVSRAYVDIDASAQSSGATNYRFHFFLTDLRLPN